MPDVNNFTVIESIYGRFVVNRRDKFQGEALVRTGRPHIQDELDVLLGIADTLPNGAFVADAGANVGEFSLMAATAGADVGRVTLAIRSMAPGGGARRGGADPAAREVRTDASQRRGSRSAVE